jgi:hypothetical protein
MMVINTDDIIQLIFFSALFLMVMGVPKILLLMAWFLWSNWIYTTSNPRITKVMREKWGYEIENLREKEPKKNQIQLMDRTVKDLKDPLIESIASIIIIYVSTGYLSLGPGSSGLLTVIEILLISSIVIGVISISLLLIKLQPYFDKIIEEEFAKKIE